MDVSKRKQHVLQINSSSRIHTDSASSKFLRFYQTEGFLIFCCVLHKFVLAIYPLCHKERFWRIKQYFKAKAKQPSILILLLRIKARIVQTVAILLFCWCWLTVMTRQHCRLSICFVWIEFDKYWTPSEQIQITIWWWEE